MDHDVEILIFNGASSAGKTTLCKAVQSLMPQPYMHFEEDRVVFDTYAERFLVGEQAAQIFTKTMLGYYRSLAAFLSAGHCVLADTGFYRRDLVAACLRELQPYRVWLIGVHCRLDELEHREQQRVDRQPGLAREQYQTIHAHMRYDIEVDTSEQSVQDCATHIVREWQRQGSPRAIEIVRATLAGLENTP